MTTVRTTFTCISIVEDSNQATVCLRPVHKDEPEDDTPSGYIEMNFTNPTIFNEFKIGHTYHVDFTEVK